MKDAWTDVFKSTTMVDGTVSLVSIPAPARVFPGEINHDPVTMDLGENRGGRHTKVVSVGPFGRQNPAWELAGIDEIGNNHRSRHYQCPSSRRHGQPSGFEDIDTIDQFRPNLAHDPACTAAQSSRGRVSATGAQKLGVLNITIVWDLFECCGTNDHWPRKSTATNLINSDNRACIEEDFPIPHTEDVDS